MNAKTTIATGILHKFNENDPKIDLPQQIHLKPDRLNHLEAPISGDASHKTQRAIQTVQPGIPGSTIVTRINTSYWGTQ
ncbi:MAG: hypothetical protein GXP18_10335 [Gammaproteobacteria bacterium]|nr:hypothetical protein [Gammaproteobacteria bacterium]